jgi:hypothetical protein
MTVDEEPSTRASTKPKVALQLIRSSAAREGREIRLSHIGSNATDSPRGEFASPAWLETQGIPISKEMKGDMLTTRNFGAESVSPFTTCTRRGCDRFSSRVHHRSAVRQLPNARPRRRRQLCSCRCAPSSALHPEGGAQSPPALPTHVACILTHWRKLNLPS